MAKTEDVVLEKLKDVTIETDKTKVRYSPIAKINSSKNQTTDVETETNRGGKLSIRETCSVENCDKYARTTGMCPRHYQQVRRHGRLTPELEYQIRGEKCSAKGCEELPVARGYCGRHYQQVRRYGRLTPERQRDVDSSPSCQVPNCEGKHAARGYCKKHYMSEYYFKKVELKECAG